MEGFYWPGGCPDPKPQKSLHNLPSPDELLLTKRHGIHQKSGLAYVNRSLYERIK